MQLSKGKFMMERLCGEWEGPTKRVCRTFQLKVEVPLHFGLVFDVLHSIENDTLNVFHPNDLYALEPVFDKSRAILLNGRATLPISILEWLCVGCQLISMGGYDYTFPEGALAIYRSNAEECLHPRDGIRPAGPAAFFGQILMTKQALPMNDSQQEIDRFKFIVAHELVHTFDKMRIVVPAFLDWKSFWRTALAEGGKCDLAVANVTYNSRLIDSYGSANELAMVEQYWPSQAERWFNALRGRGDQQRRAARRNRARTDR